MYGNKIQHPFNSTKLISTVNAAELTKLKHPPILENELTKQTKTEWYLDEAYKLSEILETIPMLVEAQQVSLYV